MKRASSTRLTEWPTPRITSVAAMASAPSRNGLEMRRLLLDGALTRLLHLRGRVLHRFDDVHVPRAAADVPGDRPANVLLARIGVLCEESGRGEHHARRAEAALKAVLLVEALLYRMEPAGGREALDGRDLVPLRLDREHRAGLHGHSVEEHRARPAARRVAADVGAGEAERLAEEVDEEE